MPRSQGFSRLTGIAWHTPCARRSHYCLSCFEGLLVSDSAKDLLEFKTSVVHSYISPATCNAAERFSVELSHN